MIFVKDMKDMEMVQVSWTEMMMMMIVVAYEVGQYILADSILNMPD